MVDVIIVCGILLGLCVVGLFYVGVLQLLDEHARRKHNRRVVDLFEYRRERHQHRIAWSQHDELQQLDEQRREHDRLAAWRD